MKDALAPSVLFEDDHFLFLNKPAGLDCSMKKDGRMNSVSRWLKNNRSELAPFGYGPEDYGLLNRIDVETSGVLVAGKSAAARDGFLTLTKMGKVKKEYLAITETIVTRSLEVTLAIGARSRTAGRVRALAKPRKKDRALPAYTVFMPLSHCTEMQSSLLKATIYQGRRHQIRAHAAASGFPLLGDILYGSLQQIPDLPGEHPAFFLHSARIAFDNPVTGKAVAVSAPAPACLHVLRKELLWFDLIKDIFA